MATPVPPVSPVLGSDPKDLTFIEDVLEQKYHLALAAYPWYVLKSIEDHGDNFNDTYGETDYNADNPHPQYKDAMQIHLVVELEPEQDLLDKYGLDKPTDALVIGSQKIFRDLAVLPKIGDRFDFNEWQFEIKTVKPGSWFSNSKADIEWIMTADRTHRRWPQ
jgi:hypothetical protein